VPVRMQATDVPIKKLMGPRWFKYKKKLI
jgi:hypothetical protein